MKKYAALFPGQGTQFIGMYRELVERFEIAKDTIREAEDITNLDIMDISQNGPIRRLATQEIAHITIVAFSVAAFRTFMSLGMPAPAACIGHSLGEYAALVCAGGMSFKDALNIVQLRCKLGSEVKRETGSSMSVLDNVNISNVIQLLKKFQLMNKKIYLACVNSNRQVTLSGKNKDLTEFEQELCQNSQCKVTPLLNSAPYHSRLMKSKLNTFIEIIDKINFSELRYPVISNITGHPYKNMKISKKYLKEHLYSTINLVGSMEYITQRNITTVVDFSGNNFFRSLLENDFDMKIYSFNGNDTVNKIKEQITQSGMNLTEKIAELVLVQPALSSDNWNEFLNGYLELKELAKERNIALERSLKLMKSCLKAKGLPENEQHIIVQQFMDENGLTYFEI